MKEDARHPSFVNLFLGAWQKRLIWFLYKQQVAAGCITILQAEHH